MCHCKQQNHPWQETIPGKTDENLHPGAWPGSSTDKKLSDLDIWLDWVLRLASVAACGVSCSSLALRADGDVAFWTWMLDARLALILRGQI